MSRRDVETTWRNLNCRGGHRQDLPKPWHQFSVINMIFLLPRKFPLGNKRSTRHGVLESMITYYEMNENASLVSYSLLPQQFSFREVVSLQSSPQQLMQRILFNFFARNNFLEHSANFSNIPKN